MRVSTRTRTDVSITSISDPSGETSRTKGAFTGRGTVSGSPPLVGIAITTTRSPTRWEK